MIEPKEALFLNLVGAKQKQRQQMQNNKGSAQIWLIFGESKMKLF